jgi:hypothetical protein
VRLEIWNPCAPDLKIKSLILDGEPELNTTHKLNSLN